MCFWGQMFIHSGPGKLAFLFQSQLRRGSIEQLTYRGPQNTILNTTDHFPQQIVPDTTFMYCDTLEASFWTPDYHNYVSGMISRVVIQDVFVVISSRQSISLENLTYLLLAKNLDPMTTAQKRYQKPNDIIHRKY